MAGSIEDYAMIGNCRSAALVSRHGVIDWLCLPRFDAEACFAALLGDDRHGHWSLQPTRPAQASRQYRDGSLVLETLWVCETGRVRVIDFMPSRERQPAGDPAESASVIRLVEGIEGRVELLSRLLPRFDYGRVVPAVRRMGCGAVTAVAGPHRLVLRGADQVEIEDAAMLARFEVAAGEVRALVLGYDASHWEVPAPLQAGRELELTEAFWHGWSSVCRRAGEWSDLVSRSLVTLKGLSYLPTGGIVAAATTSLPEQLGGARNWDYRYCWIRDASLTLSALLKAGYRDEAMAWREWVRRAVAGRPEQLQVMYGLAGERRLDEYELSWLPGYEDSRPVRVGNAAASQLQLDIFGELVGILAVTGETEMASADSDDGLGLSFMLHLEAIWQQPDEGLWEIRGEPRCFTHSRIMTWLAFRQAADSPRPVAAHHRTRWAALADRIRKEVLQKGVDSEDGHFVQSFGSRALDASLLLAPLVGFVEATDPRMRATVAAIEQRLVRGGLVMRYDTGDGVDGLQGGEGAFLACSFWLVENYVLQGRITEARAWFERLVGLCNDVGLLAEEYDPVSQRQLGNFPQAFSHVALVHAAFRLAEAEAGKATGATPPPAT